MPAEVDLLYLRARGQGWGPIDELARLCRQLLPVRQQLTVDDRGEVSVLHKAAAYLPTPRRGSTALLMIASSPAHLAYAARSTHWWPGYAVTSAWVIDSFWTDRISRFARRRGHLDHIFITDRDLTDEWQQATGATVSWAPWGTDTLAVEKSEEDRPTDVLRIGRQPMVWDDDEHTRSRAESMGIAMQGRPPLAPDSCTNQESVRRALTRAKFVLAFSNLVSPADYTHPTREYLTGRWMDALACGTTVAGAAPASATYTLWPEATVAVDPYDLNRGLNQLHEAVRRWTPATAHRHQQLARERLDWRWRLGEISERLGLPRTRAMDEDLTRLRSGQP